MIRLQRCENGSYFAAFSLHIPDMRSFAHVREIVKICPRSPIVSIKPLFSFRTPIVRQAASLWLGGAVFRRYFTLPTRYVAGTLMSITRLGRSNIFSATSFCRSLFRRHLPWAPPFCGALQLGATLLWRLSI